MLKSARVELNEEIDEIPSPTDQEEDTELLSGEDAQGLKRGKEAPGEIKGHSGFRWA